MNSLPGVFYDYSHTCFCASPVAIISWKCHSFKKSVTALGNGCCGASPGYWAVPHNVIVIFPWLWSFLCKGVRGMCGLFLPVAVGSAVCTFQRLTFAEVKSALMQSGDTENYKVPFPLDSKACWRSCYSGCHFLSPWLWQPFVDDSPFHFSSQVYTSLRGSSALSGLGNLLLAQIISGILRAVWATGTPGAGEWWNSKQDSCRLSTGADAVWVAFALGPFPLVQ